MQDIQKKLYDKDFRLRLLSQPNAVLAEINDVDFDHQIEYKVVKNTKAITYIVLHAAADTINLEQINAAGVASSASTGGTIGTATLTVGSASSAATIGSAI